MDLHLAFTDGQVNGGGNDDVGRFLIRGSYDSANRECYWTKTYPGSHDVARPRFLGRQGHLGNVGNRSDQPWRFPYLA